MWLVDVVIFLFFFFLVRGWLDDEVVGGEWGG